MIKCLIETIVAENISFTFKLLRVQYYELTTFKTRESPSLEINPSTTIPSSK